MLPFITGVILGIFNKDMKQMGFHPHLKNNFKWYTVTVLVFPVITILNVIAAKIAGALTVRVIVLTALSGLIITAFFQT